MRPRPAYPVYRMTPTLPTATGSTQTYMSRYPYHVAGHCIFTDVLCMTPGQSAQHSAAAVKAGALPALLGPAATPRIDAELAFRSRSALKAVVQWMDTASELDALLRS